MLEWRDNSSETSVWIYNNLAHLAKTILTTYLLSYRKRDKYVQGTPPYRNGSRKAHHNSVKKQTRTRTHRSWEADIWGLRRRWANSCTPGTWKSKRRTKQRNAATTVALASRPSMQCTTQMLRGLWRSHRCMFLQTANSVASGGALRALKGHSDTRESNFTERYFRGAKLYTAYCWGWLASRKARTSSIWFRKAVSSPSAGKDMTGKNRGGWLGPNHHWRVTFIANNSKFHWNGENFTFFSKISPRADL